MSPIGLEKSLLFAGDTLFALGCGRGFEEPAPILFDSLMKLSTLPGDTQVYCGHEYTLANAAFALTVDPLNEVLQHRAREIVRLRDQGCLTLPTTLAVELATNPFLRAGQVGIRNALGMCDSAPVAVFAELRDRKNRF